MSTIKINEKAYRTKTMDYAAACELEKMGLPVMDCLLGKNLSNHAFNIFRAYCAWIMDLDIEAATKEVSVHLEKGYNIDEIFDALTKQFIDFKVKYFCKEGFKFFIK